MAGLNTLPPEILSQIITQYPWKRKNDLFPLSFASKTLRRAVEPFIYKVIRFAYFERQRHFRNTVPLHYLLRTLLHRPDLCAYIWQFELRSITPATQSLQRRVQSWIFWQPGEQTPFSEDTTGLAISLINSLNPPLKNNWIRGLHEGKFIYLTALLLSQLSQLRTLCFNTIFCNRTGILPMVFDYCDIVSMQSRFSKMDHFEKDVNGNGGGECELENFLPFFYFPSLSQLRTAIPGGSLSRGHSIPLIGTLTSLTVSVTRKSLNILELVLSKCPSLTYLRMIYFHRSDQQKEQDCGKIGECLIPVRHSLEELMITLDFKMVEWREEDEDWGLYYCGRMKSLKKFTKLTRLDVPAVALFGWTLGDEDKLMNFLPSTLRSLRLSDDILRISDNIPWDRNDVLNKAAEYVKELDGNAPQLRVISFRMDHLEDEEFEPGVRAIKKVCKEVDLKLMLENHDEFLGNYPYNGYSDNEEDSEEEEVGEDGINAEGYVNEGTVNPDDNFIQYNPTVDYDPVEEDDSTEVDNNYDFATSENNGHSTISEETDRNFGLKFAHTKCLGQQ